MAAFFAAVIGSTIIDSSGGGVINPDGLSHGAICLSFTSSARMSE
jgi:hypothetical protein